MTAATKKITTPRLTPRQWAEAEALWESGEVTLIDLATRFKRDKSAFQRYFDKHKIVKGSKAAASKEAVKEAVTSAIVDDATVLANRIRETNEDHYKMSTAMAKLAWSEILAAKRDLKPFATIKDNIKTLDLAMNVLAKARAERYAILGLDKADFVDEEGLPELVISELTAAQIEELRSRDESDIETGVESVIGQPEAEFQEADLDAGGDDIVSEDA